MEAIILYYYQADAIGLITAALLIIMSIMSWSVMIIKYSDNRKQRGIELEFLQQFWLRPEQSALTTFNPSHAAARLAQSAFNTAQFCTTATPCHDVDSFVTRALRQALDQEQAALEAGLTVLASVGSSAPFIGLFGTVWSVHRALLALGSSGQATLDQVAGPVGEALVMTGAGLAVAIPALLAYNLFTRANRLRLLTLDGFAYDLHAFLVAGMRPQLARPPLPVTMHTTGTEFG